MTGYPGRQMINSATLPKSGLKRSLAIQGRVIGALLMREVLTRYGRHNIGFLWLFIEPMVFTLGVTTFWMLTRSVHGSDLPIVAFAVTGYSSVLMWRNMPARCMNAIEPNLSLMHHRNVKVIDIFGARLLLEAAGVTTSFVALTLVFTALGWMTLPENVLLVAAGWLLLTWFGASLGMILRLARSSQRSRREDLASTVLPSVPAVRRGFPGGLVSTPRAIHDPLAANGQCDGTDPGRLLWLRHPGALRRQLRDRVLYGRDAGGTGPAARHGQKGRCAVIHLHDVVKEYPTRTGMHRVLNGIDLKVARHEKVGILGRNGAGKSTLVRLISGAERPTSGRITREMTVSWPLAFSGGFQASLTGLDNLRFICRVYGCSHEDKIGFVEDFAELGRFLREPLRSYSSGMRARLAFAISMVIEFDCFLIDEVIAVGDSRFHEKCRLELFEKRSDRAMILVSHNADFLRDHCNRAVILDNGKLQSAASLDDALATHEALQSA